MAGGCSVSLLWCATENVLLRSDGLVLDCWDWSWKRADGSVGNGARPVDARTAFRRIARATELRRVPVGVIGPRDASACQTEAAEAVGRGLAELGLSVICGGMGGVMSAAAKGAHSAGGLTIGLLPGHDWREANAHISIPIATGLSEARNMIIAKSAHALIAVGDSHGTLSEIAYGLHFGKRIFGLAGAAQLEGIEQVATTDDAVRRTAEVLLEAAPVK